MKTVGNHVQQADFTVVRTIAVPPRASRMWLQCSAQNLRFTVDGITAPTSIKGFQLLAGDPIYPIDVESNGSVKFIQEAPTATLEYQFGE